MLEPLFLYENSFFQVDFFVYKQTNKKTEKVLLEEEKKNKTMDYSYGYLWLLCFD